MTKPRRIHSIFQKNSLLHTLSQHAQRLEQLSYLLQHALPSQFATHCRLANINGNTLVLHVDNALYASLIRFQAPALIKTIASELDLTISHIDVKVRHLHTAANPVASHQISLPATAATSLQQTAQSLDDGPLKQSLEKLAKRFSV